MAIDEDTEVMDNTAGDIGEKSPKLYLESKGWIGGTGEFAQYLFSKDNRTFTIGVEENTFHSDLEKESFLFQVSEKESGIDQEGFNKIRQYEQGEFERKDSDNPIYQKTLSFETEKNRQKVYSLYLEYINRWGMPLIGDKGAVENYGNILSGTFKSKKLVIDKKCPEIAGLKLEKADKKKEGIRFAKKSVSETYNTDEIYNTDKKCNTDITYNIDEECYYNTSVKGMIDIREKYLDLDSIHIQAMPLDDRAREAVKENEAESNDGMLDILGWTHTKKGNLHQISFDFAVEGKWKFILDCADLAGNADNPLTIQADLEDNAGHTEKNILNEKVVIDNTKPEIEVVYDQNNQTQYYNFSRKATVTVKEKNFSPDLVVWNIQGSNQKYQIGEWKNVQGTYVCEISFEEDGRDYSVGLSVTDKAGNKSEWKDRNYFTIDKTAPQISIQINGIGKQADQVPYFNTERIITFCIQEQNFDKDKVEYNIDTIHGKSRITIKKPVKYQEDGDKYYSRLVLKKEAKYHIQVKCTDKAGNVSETAETKEFIIDTTTPAVHIAGVKQNGIYQGKKIMPQVICKDQYLDRESVEISLKKIDDRNVLKKEWSYERAESENTVQVQWDNIKKTENSDGIYYLQIKGQDKAGNKIKDDFKVVFRVNQRGADFILSHALKKKINKYYLKEAPKIKLREQCVKQTKSRAVILKDNEERKVIGESSITSSVIADKKSERYGWYEKYYNFAKKDFEREGDYRVTFQADTKEKELRFVVDRTPPVVHIGNLDKQIYEEKEHEFTIRVMDNYAFKELELYMETDRDILGQKGTKKIIIKPKDLDENYMVRKTLTADKRYQTVRYIARDKAGNVIDSNDNGDTKVCLVTDSKTVKEYQEHKKEYMLIGIISTLGIFIVISGSGLFIFTRRKRNLK